MTTMISFTNGNVVNCSKITLDIPCALCVFSITRAKMKSVQRQQQPAKESSISNAVIGSKRGPHTWNRHLFFFLPLSCWLATYKFSSRFNWYKKFGHNGMQWALKMWTNFSKEKVSVAVKGVGWLWCQKQWKLCSYLSRIMFQACHLRRNALFQF